MSAAQPGSYSWPVHLAKFVPADTNAWKMAAGKIAPLKNAPTRGSWIRSGQTVTLTVLKRIDSRMSTLSLINGFTYEHHYISRISFHHPKIHAVNIRQYWKSSVNTENDLEGSRVIFCAYTSDIVHKFAVIFSSTAQALDCFMCLKPKAFRGDQIFMMLRIESATPAVDKQDIISAELKSGSSHIQDSCSKPEPENGLQHDSADPNPGRESITVHGDTYMRESEAFHKDLGGATEQSNSQREGTQTSVHPQEEVPWQPSGSLHMPAGLFAAETDRAASVGTCSTAGQPRLTAGRYNYAPQVLETAERNHCMVRNPSIPIQFHRQSSGACQPSDLEPQRPSIPPSMPKPFRQGRCHSTTGDHLVPSKPGPHVDPLTSASLVDMNAAVQQLEELFGGNPDLDISVEDLYTRIEESGILEGGSQETELCAQLLNSLFDARFQEYVANVEQKSEAL